MTDARREPPTWLLKTVMAVCIAWCAIGVLALILPAGDVRRVVRLGDFSHDATLGALPWRVTLEEVDSRLAAGTLQGELVWKRRSDLGILTPIFEKRYEFVLHGDAPAGVEPLSLEDAESLLTGAFATLPPDADRELIAARNEFLLAIAPRSAFDELVVGYLIFDLTVVIAAIGAFLSFRALRKRRAAHTA
jgi:hypothetical protein